ncbi:efflux RND transporter periplasmic adaptor subunit [Aliidiomarina iranensis]|uniref:Efflux RND transporter periplasmic adaptor subunit n=1 Tax=Aliidiomarina iranensis TaxID=1434071 RepID=A0A432W0W9_9GAMM|nr:efflux RND transporter periplasmic adaptor subunit [Aliidiomarina iranensis]RUO22633.1 efflux RND transporter periplasmic adaptor subunit [Aliidiomarina iranensis]
MAMKKRFIFLPIILIAAAIVIFIFMGKARTPPPQQTNERLPVLVEYHLAERKEVQFSVPAQGNVMPRFATQVTAEVSGRIAWVSPKFEAGGFFDAGEPMLRIDEFDYATAVEEAKANLARAQASVAEERARGQVAEAEWRSIEAGDIPDLGLRRPQIASELANLRSAEARLAQAERNLERTEIKAPFAGVLQARNVNLGQYISVNSNVATLFGTDTAEIRLPLSDFDLALLDVPTGREPNFVGPRVILRAEIGGLTRQWLGNLVRTEGVVDSDRRVTFAVVEVLDPYNRDEAPHAQPLTFGRFVRAEVQGISVQGLIELPRYAVNSNQQVWVITSENTIEQRTIDVYRRINDTVYVSGGLQDGERVMLTQLETPLNGMRVRTPDDIESPRGQTAANEE